jgi:tRNA-splicing endonuclease subunit Sen2
MADTTTEHTVPSSDATATAPSNSTSTPPSNKNNSGGSRKALNKLYALPAPLRTFPIPSFVPQNPLSLFHIIYAWVSHTLSLKSSAFDPHYQGWFSPETRSVHVTDFRSIRGLWEQGFYGKGTLSRSEPNWLKGEKAKRAAGKGKARTSEENTLRRRAERQQVKWERARLQQEAIDLKILEEAAANSSDIVVNGNSLPLEAASVPAEKSSLPALKSCDEPISLSQHQIFLAPVGPRELLQLPNSAADGSHEIFRFMHQTQAGTKSTFPHLSLLESSSTAPVGPLELLSLPNSIDSLSSVDLRSVDSLSSSEERAGRASSTDSPDEDVVILESKTNCNGISHSCTNGHTGDSTSSPTPNAKAEISDGLSELSENVSGAPHIDVLPLLPKIKRQKSVRFSPTVEHNTFLQTEPPSPVRSEEPSANTVSVLEVIPSILEQELVEIRDQEHTQLTLEEAFFLSYGLGALNVLDPKSETPISNKALFELFRRTSYFPPVSGDTSLLPDDPFLLSYVVYHHFRSLGWVVRSGIKFAVDYMLYVRGPVFTHAEFAVVILPSYSDPYYANDAAAKAKEQRTWAWMSCVNRVITQVKKTLILVYVDIPRPLDEEEESKMSIAGVLGRYKVREVVMKRWVSNRQRT